MTEHEIIKHINDGANYYVSLFGKAEHMETIDREYYSYVKPKESQHGISIIYNVHLDNVSSDEQAKIISEIKELKMPIWLDLTASDEVFWQVFGRNKMHGQTVFEDNDEIYMALLPEECRINISEGEQITKVQTKDDFAVWTKIANDILANGYPDMHPIYHYPLCQEGIMKCYTLYNQGRPVAVASVIDNSGIASLEFVATIPEMRRQGFSRMVCEKAVYDAFAEGAKIVTVRAIDSIASKVYESIGFKAYNYVI